MKDIKIAVECSRNRFFKERSEESFENYISRLRAIKILSLEHKDWFRRKRLKKLLKKESKKFEIYINDISVIIGDNTPEEIYDKFVDEVYRKHIILDIIN